VTGAIGRRTEARSFSQEAVRVAEQLVARRPGPTSQEMLAIALFQAASTAEEAEALVAWQRVATAFDEVLAGQPNALAKMRNVALAQKYLGGWYDQHGREAEALPHYRRALSLDERRLAAEPSNRQAQFDVAIDQANVAIVLRASGDLPGAIALFEQSLRTRRQLAASDPNDVLTASRVGAGAVRLADAYFAAGRFPEALETGHEAVRAYERSITGRTDIAGLTELARAHFQLGRARDALGQPTAACASYREARARFRQAPASGADRESVLRTHVDQRATACESTAP
jgi:tetratricopeptide (TPR) repeat protein